MDPRCTISGCVLEKRDNTRDGNEQEIIHALWEMGATWRRIDATLGGEMAGVPDLLVGLDGKNYLLEVKTARGSLNAYQKDFHNRWLGEAHVVRSADDVQRILNPASLEDTQPSLSTLRIKFTRKPKWLQELNQ